MTKLKNIINVFFSLLIMIIALTYYENRSNHKNYPKFISFFISLLLHCTIYQTNIKLLGRLVNLKKLYMSSYLFLLFLLGTKHLHNPTSNDHFPPKKNKCNGKKEKEEIIINLQWSIKSCIARGST